MTNFNFTETRTFEGYEYIVFEGSFYKGCSRCGGTGHHSFNGFDSICYKCGDTLDARLGDRFENEAAAQKWCHERFVRRAQRERKAEAERVEKNNRRQAAWDRLKEAHPEVFALVDQARFNEDNAERDQFVLKLADQMWNLDNNGYTDRQIAALQRVVDQRKARTEQAELNPAPTGRVVVTGTIKSAKLQDGDYGVAYKILVESDEGFKVWCSLPSAQAAQAMESFYEEIEAQGYSAHDFGSGVWLIGSHGDDRFPGVKGRRITFTATLSPSKDDKGFAFGSRPTKGSWL
jgi:hypothetical protein